MRRPTSTTPSPPDVDDTVYAGTSTPGVAYPAAMTDDVRRRLSAAAVRAGRRPLTASAAPVRLDGGASTSLQARGYDIAGPLWSARLLDDAPEAVSEMHSCFLAAGAELVVTLSYQLASASMTAAGRDAEDTSHLMSRSVQLARDAVDAHDEPALVGASIGPYGAVRADGSEYRGGYDVDRAALLRFHRERLEVLAGLDVDVIVCETIPSASEVQALAEALAYLEIPALVSVSLADDGLHTAEGQPLVEALEPVVELEHVVAVGVNCVPQRLVTPAIDALCRLDTPLLAKPNTQREDIDDPRRWIDAGAALIGGCCGTGPDDLRRLLASTRRQR